MNEHRDRSSCPRLVSRTNALSNREFRACSHVPDKPTLPTLSCPVLHTYLQQAPRGFDGGAIGPPEAMQRHLSHVSYCQDRQESCLRLLLQLPLDRMVPFFAHSLWPFRLWISSVPGAGRGLALRVFMVLEIVRKSVSMYIQ